MLKIAGMLMRTGKTAGAMKEQRNGRVAGGRAGVFLPYIALFDPKMGIIRIFRFRLLFE